MSSIFMISTPVTAAALGTPRDDRSLAVTNAVAGTAANAVAKAAVKAVANAEGARTWGRPPRGTPR